MTNPIQAMFEAGVVEATDFPPESRYHGLPTRSVPGPDGVAIPYLARRLVPDPDAFAVQRQHRVVAGERLDQVAWAEIGDPQAFWQLCDANGTLWPDELEAAGEVVAIALPAGVAPGEEDG